MDFRGLLRRAWQRGAPFFKGSLSRQRGPHDILVLMYHEVLKDAEEIEAWTVVRESAFREQMEYLSHHYKIVALDEALQGMNSPRGKREGLAVVTFDDGYSGNYRTMLPIIESMKIPVTVFVATGAVQTQTRYWYDRLILALQPGSTGTVTINLKEFGLKKYSLGPKDREEAGWTGIQRLLTDLKTLSPASREKAVASVLSQANGRSHETPGILSPLSVDDLKALAASPWVTLGAHSHCHNLLVQLSREQMSKSIQTSKSLLEDWTGRQVTHFAYPNGDYNAEVMECVRRAGFASAMAIHPRAWNESDSVYAIPRLGVGRYDSTESFKAML
ncbi:MAG: polysaccharide deacetylase family protein [Acidobacteriia bacterium]|nr:polysaccharide deacetylase family protein [Terriglobia bacterium]